MVEQDSAIDSNDVTVNISVERPKIENLKIAALARDLEQDLKAQIVVMKANFMNEIYELRSEIVGLEKQIWIDLVTKIMFKMNTLLQQENQYVKHELQQKQLVIEKILDMKENSLRNHYNITTPMAIKPI